MMLITLSGHSEPKPVKLGMWCLAFPSAKALCNLDSAWHFHPPRLLCTLDSACFQWGLGQGALGPTTMMVWQWIVHSPFKRLEQGTNGVMQHFRCLQVCAGLAGSLDFAPPRHGHSISRTTI